VTVVARARIIKASAVQPGVPLFRVRVEATRRIAKEAVDASLLAKRILDRVRAEAKETIEAAQEQAAHAAALAAKEARESEVAKLAAGFLALRVEDERRSERDLDRVVALARVLAERLLGEALETDPVRIVALARQALSEARGARRAVIFVSPDDESTLRGHLCVLRPSDRFQDGIDIRIDPHLSRGSLRIHTNMGDLDAQLTPQLDRLAKALRDALT
jgi:flagellar biosynthesis/type III secretory pathway protein FliH